MTTSNRRLTAVVASRSGLVVAVHPVKRLSRALSHGCIRLENSSIDWLVGRIGAEGLPGIPVWVK